MKTSERYLGYAEYNGKEGRIVGYAKCNYMGKEPLDDGSCSCCKECVGHVKFEIGGERSKGCFVHNGKRDLMHPKMPERIGRLLRPLD